MCGPEGFVDAIWAKISVYADSRHGEHDWLSPDNNEVKDEGNAVKRLLPE